MSRTVFNRVNIAYDTISRNLFFGIIAAILVWGFVATAYVSQLTADWRPGLGEFLAVAIIPFIGLGLSWSRNALVSFLGFNLVAIPLGAILGPELAIHKIAQPGVVTETAWLTAAITGAMGASGVLFPRFYSRIGGALFVALCCLLVVMIVGIFVPAIGNMGGISYVGAGLFSLYIGYDMHRACTIPATVDNAVDVTIALYLDIFNLFKFLLNIKAD